MKKIWGLLFLASALFFSCSNNKKVENSRTLKTGTWRIELQLGEAILPFNFILLEKSGSYEMAIINASESIKINNIQREGDSIFIKMPVFDSEFVGKIIDSSHIEGVWINHYISSDYKIPFTAQYGNNFRFTAEKSVVEEDLSGKYEVTFSPGKKTESKAIGIFKQHPKDKNRIKGTFLTETGDYRFLEGNYIKDSIFLSAFDGSHAYLFKAKKENGKISGVFYSGKHFKEDWIAEKNVNFELRDPYSLTYLKKGYTKFDFSFPNLEGEIVSLSDEKYQDKVVIVQLMGSWCPNCMDETIYFTELHKKYKEEGLEIVALAFERTNNYAKAVELVKKLKVTFDADYDFLIAAYERNAKIDSLLPMINHLMSFPTAIYIDQDGMVRQIHTGFYGPGTGNYYIRYKEKTDAFLRELLGLNKQL